MIITNGAVFGEDKTFSVRDLYIENGRIVPDREQVSDTATLDAEGLYVLPGLIDVHSHGACGYDFSDADNEGLRQILRYEAKHGITTYCPTTMALPKERLLKIFTAANDFMEALENISGASPAGSAHDERDRLSHIGGFHMEGPFLDPKKRGAHKEEYLLAPDAGFFRACSQCSGNRIRLVTLAPDTDNALSFIKELHGEVAISLGHTSADYLTCKAALKAGARHVTHLYNAMTPFHHREPGLIGAAAESADCMAELICDGIHVHESMVRAAFRLFPGRIVLISDSMRATGMGDGVYELGGQKVTVTGKQAVLEDGTVAGSVTNLYDCMRTAVSFGIPLEEAVAAAAYNPARSIGIYDSVGSLTPGKRADILLADKELNLLRVLTT